MKRGITRNSRVVKNSLMRVASGATMVRSWPMLPLRAMSELEAL